MDPNPKMRPGLVVFDLDGTLLDSRKLAVAAVLAACRAAFADSGLRAPLPSEAAVLDCIGLPAPDFHDRLLRKHDAPLRRSAERHCERIEAELIRRGEMKLFPAVLDVLATLRGRGLHLAVASNCAPDYLSESLEHCGLRPFFDAALCPGLRAGASKGALLLELVETFGREAVMVGDRRSDGDAAARAEVPFWACHWGFGRAEELEGAQRHLNTLEDLLLPWS